MGGVALAAAVAAVLLADPSSAYSGVVVRPLKGQLARTHVPLGTRVTIRA